MSWDVVLFNSNQEIKSVADLDENDLVPTEFDSALENHFKQMIKEENRREIKGSDFSIDYYVNGEDVSNKMLSIYGQNGIYALIEFAKKHNYQLYDSGFDGMLDLEKPEKNGYGDFQKYLKHVLRS